MSPLPTTSLPCDRRFQRQGPAEPFVEESTIEKMIAAAAMPWRDRTYQGEDYAGRDDLPGDVGIPHQPITAHPDHAEAENKPAFLRKEACSPLGSPTTLKTTAVPEATENMVSIPVEQVGAEKNGFPLRWTTVIYWLIIALLMAYIVLSLIDAFWPNLLQNTPSWFRPMRLLELYSSAPAFIFHHPISP